MATAAINAGDGFDPVQLAIMANRVQAITREMTNTVVLTARSSVIGMARDFSCAILTGNSELPDAAEGLPVHIFGINLQAKAMRTLHPDLREGDAFLHNDPYLGNSHPADHATLVPVFVDGEHLFTAAVKAHQADCGNAIPTTYYAAAKDVYMEGSLNFPCVKVQSGYKDNDDIIRMCRKRIRIPDQWYGDYLAGIGAARIGSRNSSPSTARTRSSASSRRGLITLNAAPRTRFASCRRPGSCITASSIPCRRFSPTVCRSR